MLKSLVKAAVPAAVAAAATVELQNLAVVAELLRNDAVPPALILFAWFLSRLPLQQSQEPMDRQSDTHSRRPRRKRKAKPSVETEPALFESMPIDTQDPQ